ncbi:CRISPR-associated protein, Csd2 family [Alkaliphilus metalliredigens QYMF]|uniref:CRISPR-associated protein, Csd2 family n=1 Tax=Alkaliphilus metalliredigens (strain QYMF) TaxID=293826 RepID=A6TNS4_ALKMQ|nr:type I-C CRISPR-associated protein Cas7/Csd2 [Alkaliphilus metalliredigens]ABR47842.1 CRISPR-associated protein, Csd2 family [Alkaliphilus metalliredigens QYMF]
MSNFENKIDFAVVISVKNANPNGDPLNGNRPRENYDGFGEISDVCIKRKIRNRFQDMDQAIFVQSDERRTDGFRSLKDRADGCEELKKSSKDKEQYAKIACEKWIDVRSFGQVFAFKKGGDDNSVSIGIRGPVSIHSAVSISPIEISSMQITKSVNGETGKDPDKKSPDTMGMKHRVEFGAYVIYGSINTQLATKTGFNQEDSELVKKALITLFENDCSSARPDGSMEVCKLYWWKHNSKIGQYSSAKVHRTLRIAPTIEMPKDINDYNITHETLDGLAPEIYDGI